MNLESVIAAMLALPQCVLDVGDSPEARLALYRPVAESILRTARTPEEIAALIADGWHETKFARAVLEGRCQDMPVGQRCDAGRARGPFQVWSWCKATDTAGEARCTISQMRMGLARCAGWEGAFAALHGASCSWHGAAARVQTQRQILRRWGMQ